MLRQLDDSVLGQLRTDAQVNEIKSVGITVVEVTAVTVVAVRTRA